MMPVRAIGRRTRWLWYVGLGLGLVGLVLVPAESTVRSIWYLVLSAIALGWAGYGIYRQRPARLRIWLVMLSGLGCWLLGDVIWHVMQELMGIEMFPSVADLAYLSGYPLLALGLAMLVRGRQQGRDRSAFLDAAIVTTGVGVLAAVFLIAPTVVDTSQGALSRAVATAYPLGDLLLLSMLARLWTAPGARTVAYRLLALSLTATLLGDIGYNAAYVATGEESTSVVLDVLWLLSYVLFAVCATHPSMRTLSEASPEQHSTFTRRRMVALAMASMLAPVTLLLQGASGREVSWFVVGTGSILLFALVLARVAGLLSEVQRQAVQLAALARSDGLTGIPNRRTWDHELSRACAKARDDGTPLCVALIDLDHFKNFNDTLGHQAGDRLLVEATAAWTAALGRRGMMARYGGEEFAVLLPGLGTDSAVDVLRELSALTPSGQTVSVGVACWDTVELPGNILARADVALYEAKRQGRNQVRVSATDITPAVSASAPVGVPAGR